MLFGPLAYIFLFQAKIILLAADFILRIIRLLGQSIRERARLLQRRPSLAQTVRSQTEDSRVLLRRLGRWHRRHGGPQARRLRRQGQGQR